MIHADVSSERFENVVLRRNFKLISLMCVFQKNSMLKSVQLKSDVSLLRSQTEQGTAESQDWLLGPERVLRHLQPI